MPDTKTSMGEQGVLDGLVGNRLADLEESSCWKIGSYGLYNNSALTGLRIPNVSRIEEYGVSGCSGLTSLVLPKVTHVGVRAFQSCSGLQVVDFQSADPVTFYNYAFNNCFALKEMILRSSSPATLAGTAAMTGTSIGLNLGAVYVPTALVDTYKNDTNWSLYTILDINEYPKTDFSTIADDWDTIISYATYGTIGDHYRVGDNKTIQIGGDTYYAQLIGINKDKVSEGPTANSTWMIQILFGTPTEGSTYMYQQMNATNTTSGGWANSLLRTNYLENVVLPLFPTNVRDAIKTVDKTYYDYDTSSTKISQDKLFVPSLRELNITGSYNIEDSGCVYDDKWPSGSGQNSRVKYLPNGSAYYSWTRTAGSDSMFYTIYDLGVSTYNQATNSCGVNLMFCL